MCKIEMMIKDRFIVCNLSNFTLGGEVRVMYKGKCETVTHARSMEDTKNIVYSLALAEKINNVFIVPLAPMKGENILEEFKVYGQENFSKTFDKIHFHVL